MNAASVARCLPSEARADLTRRRIEAALKRRQRYRYVQARIERQDDGWFVRSPCCSRRIDAQGGEIDIAWLQPLSGPQWRLHAREHAAGCWRPVLEAPLNEALQRLSGDPLREFWV